MSKCACRGRRTNTIDVKWRCASFVSSLCYKVNGVARMRHLPVIALDATQSDVHARRTKRVVVGVKKLNTQLAQDMRKIGATFIHDGFDLNTQSGWVLVSLSSEFLYIIVIASVSLQ